MAIWGKIIGGVSGFALGGPLGALFGAVAGHAVDKMRDEGGAGLAGGRDQREVAFTLAVIALSAKMAKADGQVTRDEVNAFKAMFHIPPGEMKNVARLFDEAKESTNGFEAYAEQIAGLFAHQPAVLEELLGSLFHIAKADGIVHPGEIDFLRKVAGIFGFDAHGFDRIRESYMPAGAAANPYAVLGVSESDGDDKIKAAYRKLTIENHPDKLMAEGMPEEFIDIANEKMAAINAAYDQIKKSRGIK